MSECGVFDVACLTLTLLTMGFQSGEEFVVAVREADALGATH